MHLAIYVYWTSPALEEPHAVSLCPGGRSLQEETTDDNAQVTCKECLGIMARLLL